MWLIQRVVSHGVVSLTQQLMPVVVVFVIVAAAAAVVVVVVVVVGGGGGGGGGWWWWWWWWWRWRRQRRRGYLCATPFKSCGVEFCLLAKRILEVHLECYHGKPVTRLLSRNLLMQVRFTCFCFSAVMN